jgi:uncharacterized protein (DUF486 family)
MLTIALLVCSNVFMTFAWPLWQAVLVSWGIAFIEYCLAVPANRYGYGQFTGVELKTIQEIVTLAVFAAFAIFWLGESIRWNHLAAFACLVAAAFFMFQK